MPAHEGSLLHTYQLDPKPGPERSPRPVKQPGSATLLVNIPKPRAGFETPRMAYLLRPHEVQYYARSEWVDSPPRMLLPPLTRVLEQSRIWNAVVVAPSLVRGDYRLDLDNLALQHEFFTQPSQLHLLARAQVVDLHEQCVVGTTDFDVVEPAPSDDPYGGVLAANNAVGKFLEQLVAWLGTYMNEGARAGCPRSTPAANRTTTGQKT